MIMEGSFLLTIIFSTGLVLFLFSRYAINRSRQVHNHQLRILAGDELKYSERGLLRDDFDRKKLEFMTELLCDLALEINAM